MNAAPALAPLAATPTCHTPSSSASTPSMMTPGGAGNGAGGFRIVSVGSRVTSQRHFEEWLNSPEPFHKLRSPGKHYASHARQRGARSANLGTASEGNRFIRNDML